MISTTIGFLRRMVKKFHQQKKQCLNKNNQPSKFKGKTLQI